MIASQLMDRAPKTVHPEMTIRELASFFRKNRVHGAPVVKKGKLIGIVTEYDLLDFIEIHDFGKDLFLPAPFDFIEAVLEAKQDQIEIAREFQKLKLGTVEKIMSKKVRTVSPETHVSEMAEIMTDERITHLPVVDAKGKLVGALTRGDLLKALL